MAPYEALYGRKKIYRSPIHWFEIEEKMLINHELVERTTKAI